jgi:hypothetical protein
MSYIELQEALNSLKLTGMLERLIAYEESAPKEMITRHDWLHMLLEAEQLMRKTRSIS